MLLSRPAVASYALIHSAPHSQGEQHTMGQT